MKAPDSKSQPRVFLIEENANFDLTAANRYGKLVYLCDKMLNCFNAEGAPALIGERLHEYKFDPDRDFICLTGQALKVAMFLAVATHMYPTLRVLMFDAKMAAYRERRLSFEESLAGLTT